MSAAIRLALVLACLLATQVGPAAEPPPATDLSGDPLPTCATLRLGTLRFRTPAHVVAYFPDGKSLVTAGHTTTVWDVETGKQVRRILTPNALVYSVAVSPDGKTIATCGNSPFSYPEMVIRLWDAATAKEVRQLVGHKDSVATVAFSADGRSLASASHDGTARLWEVATGKELLQLESNVGCYVVALSPDGRKLCTAGKDGRPRIWELATGRVTGEFPAAGGEIHSVAFSPDGELLAWGGLDRVFVGRVATGELVRQVVVPIKDRLQVAFSADGKTLASGGFYTGARLWDVATGQMIRALAGPTVAGFAFSPDGKTLAGVGGSHSVQFWEVATGRQVPQLVGHTGPVSAVAFTPDGRSVASGGQDGTVRRWDAATGRQVGQFTTLAKRFQPYAFTPDARLVAAAGLGAWDVSSGVSRPGFVGGAKGEGFAAFSPDGRFLAESGAPSRLWDVTTGKEIAQAGAIHQAGVNAIAVSPDGALMAEASHVGIIRLCGRVILWDRDGREVRQFGQGNISYSGLAFSPDGKTLATCTDHAWADQGGVQLWDVATGQLIRRLGGLAHPLASLSRPTARWLRWVGSRRSNSGTGPLVKRSPGSRDTKATLLRSRFPPTARGWLRAARIRQYSSGQLTNSLGGNYQLEQVKFD